MQSIRFKVAGDSQAVAYERPDSRRTHVITRRSRYLADLHVRSVKLLANGSGKADELRRLAVVVERCNSALRN